MNDEQKKIVEENVVEICCEDAEGHEERGTGFYINKDIFFMLIAYLSGIVPWIFIKRASFAYHYFPCVPFLILMFVYFLKDYAYPKYGNKILFITIFLTALLFFMFYPVISGMPVNKSYINRFLRWFDSWDLY